MAEIARGLGDLFGIDDQGAIYRYIPDSHYWRPLPGAASAIAVDSANRPWVIGGGGTLWQGNRDGAWQGVPGSATSVGAGGGRVFASGWGVYSWNGGGWDDWGASGFSRVAGDPWALPWALGYNGTIWRYSGGWQPLPGAAVDISVTRSGTTYVIGTDQQIYRSGLSEVGFYWEPLGRYGKRVVGGGNSGEYYYIDLNGTVQHAGRKRPQDDGWIYRPGTDDYWMPRPAGGCPDIGLVCHDEHTHDGCSPHVHTYVTDEEWTSEGVICVARKVYTECRSDLISCDYWDGD